MRPGRLCKEEGDESKRQAGTAADNVIPSLVGRSQPLQQSAQPLPGQPIQDRGGLPQQPVITQHTYSQDDILPNISHLLLSIIGNTCHRAPDIALNLYIGDSESGMSLEKCITSE